jgi:hypothetical protein
MSSQIPVAALQQIPFLQSPMTAAYGIASLSFYVGGCWHCWIPHGETLVKVTMSPVDADYFGDVPERASDQCFALFNMIAQRTLDGQMIRHFRAMRNDYQGLSASLAKIRLFHQQRSQKEFGIPRFVQTEIEYLVTLCRSIFDLLQGLVRCHVARLRVHNGPQPKQLPESFAHVVSKNEKELSASEIVARYDLPYPIAEWYARHSDFFMKLRTIRDRMVHHGSSIELIFSSDRGFAVLRHSDPFGGLHDWPSECELPNALVPIRPVLARIVKNTLGACDDFTATWSSSIGMPADVAPNLKFYSRGTNDREFHCLDDAIANSRWDDTFAP